MGEQRFYRASASADVFPRRQFAKMGRRHRRRAARIVSANPTAARVAWDCHQLRVHRARCLGDNRFSASGWAFSASMAARRG